MASTNNKFNWRCFLAILGGLWLGGSILSLQTLALASTLNEGNQEECFSRYDQQGEYSQEEGNNPKIRYQSFRISPIRVSNSEITECIQTIENWYGDKNGNWSEITCDELKGLITQITGLYVRRGYITSLAFLAEEKPKLSQQQNCEYISSIVISNDNNIDIQIIEGQVEEIDIRIFPQPSSTSRDTQTEEESTENAAPVDVPTDENISNEDEVAAEASVQTDATPRGAVEQSLYEGYVRNRIKLGLGTPFQVGPLENQLRLLRMEPHIASVEASLRKAGEDEDGKSILTVNVTVEDRFSGTIRVDNYSPPSVGADRLGFDIALQPLTHVGDSVALSYNRTTRGGAQVLDLGYRLPLNPRGGSIDAQVTLERNEVVQEPFAALDIEGESENYSLSYRQPLTRTPTEEFALSFGFNHRDGKTLAFDQIPISPGSDDEGVTRTSVFQFGQDYINRSRSGAWALRSQFNLGVDLLDATVNDEGADAIFFSWIGQVQRAQRIGRQNLLILQLDSQFTPDPLLTSEQFVIGGGQSVRGFRQNVRAGDNGVRFSTEYRHTLASKEEHYQLQMAPFFDLGTVWNNAKNEELPDQKFIAGLGMSLILTVEEDWPDMRLDFALPLVDLDDRGFNAQDNGIYFSINYDL
ncbi:MAG: ShlB/FhaC/HecB family hemolysin secretion/activation protein [Cyanobacteria bacterium P01_F01_bin.150]